MQKLITVFFLLFLSFFSFAQNTSISGRAIGAEGMKIRLITTADYISELPKKIDEYIIDSSGNFKLRTSLNECIYVQLQIDIYKGDFYLEPGKSYNISITPMQYKEDEKISPFLNKKKLEIVTDKIDSNELNQQISKFNALYDDFVIKNFNILYNSRNKAKLDSFQLKLNLYFSSSKNSFLNNYIKYRIAGLEQMSHIKNTLKFYTAYIQNQPILYNHIEYMYFFNEFYEKFLFNGNHKLRDDDLQAFVNEKNHLGLMDAMGRDSLVKNEVIRELVFLKGMRDLYYSNNFDKENIISMLYKFSGKTKFKEHKIIANNLIIAFNKLKIGGKAPDFKLKTIKGEIYSLANFYGKYTYLGFFTTWCAACINDNEAIAVLKKKYGDRINFVSISIDKQELNLNYYLDKHKYDWYFLHYGNNIELLENYGVYSYPFFILLDGNGNIVNYPALMPGENIEDVFKSVLGNK
ncbi:MAG: TlpA disulfide reductase family protein [Bacteroidetes bacterium]|nr:TlpA disulfide reductase family protein [Bacteroidota bacterium]